MLEESLAFYITALRKDLNAYSDARLKQYGLTDGLFYYIIFIGKHPGCSLSDAARFLRVDNGHVTRCISRLEQLGYAVRTRDGEDRRHYHLTLTERGEEIFSELHTLLSDWDEAAFSALNREQKDQLLSLLRLVMVSMDGGKGDGPCTRP